MADASSSLVVNAIQIEAVDPLGLADFWSQLLGAPVSPGSDDGSASLMSTSRSPAIVFERTDEPKISRNRVSFRLVTEAFDAHLSRLLEMQVPFVRTDRSRTGETSAQFLDPEGNEFTVAQRLHIP